MFMKKIKCSMVIGIVVCALILTLDACDVPKPEVEIVKAGTPVAYPPEGKYTSVQNVILFSATDGASIYYTTNGNTPSTSSTRYTNPITVNSTTILKAMAVVSGMNNSNILEAVYTINIPLVTEKAAMPVANPPGGTYTGTQLVTLTSATEGAVIYYTTDGSTPNSSSALYTGTIAVSDTTSTTTIRAIAVKSGMENSDVRAAIYSILKPEMGPLTDAKWLEILQGIEADSTFNGTLDLSGYTRSDSETGSGLRSNGTFDPGIYIIGKGKIVSFILPNTTTGIVSGTIDSPAFRHFTRLETFSGTLLSAIGEYAFAGCTKLSMTSLPAWVTSISTGAFQNCTSLTQLTLPTGLTSIGDSVFSGCTGLTVINIDSNNSDYSTQDGIFYNKAKTQIIIYPPGIKGDFSIPNSVMSIGNYAFMRCSGLTGISIPNNMTSIGNSAFEDCTGLTSIEISGSVTNVGNSAFKGCTGLTNITISGSVINIGNSSFEGCASLTSITVPSSVTSIGRAAFSGCTGLTSMTIPFAGNSLNGASNTHFGYIFGASSTSGQNTFIPASLKTVVITSGNSIANSAFSGCTNLENITIPNTVTSIGSFTFEECNGLTRLSNLAVMTHNKKKN